MPILGEKTIFKLTFAGLSGTWGTTTSQNSQIDLSATIHNENPYPLLAPKVKCTIESNGLIVAYGETGLLNTLEPDSTEEVKFVATLNTSLMNEWFIQHIQQDEKSEFVIRVFMGFDVNDEILKILAKVETKKVKKVKKVVSKKKATAAAGSSTTKSAAKTRVTRVTGTKLKKK